MESFAALAAIVKYLPSSEQIFQYEMILAIMGFGLGVGIWALGKWINPLRWPQKEAGIHDDDNHSTEQPTPINPLTRERAFLLAIVLGAVTYGLLSLPWFLVRWFDIKITCPECTCELGYPLFWTFVGYDKPFLGIGLFYYSYHLVALIPHFQDVMERCPDVVCVLILVPFVFFWYIGLRHWRYGLFVPFAFAVIHVVISMVGYIDAVRPR